MNIDILTSTNLNQALAHLPLTQDQLMPRQQHLMSEQHHLMSENQHLMS
jgi:hypothetical protein